ncbi:putative pumilio domain-containing protein [Cricetulus griseus]|nr:putative pumilio domain-containing protein [Cricetulus griseus]
MEQASHGLEQSIVHQVEQFEHVGQKLAEFRSFKSHVRKMLRHSEAIMEYAYNDKAILEKRNMLTEELYGNRFQIYKSADHPTLDKIKYFACASLELVSPCGQGPYQNCIYTDARKPSVTLAPEDLTSSHFTIKVARHQQKQMAQLDFKYNSEEFVYMVEYIDRFSYDESTLHHWDEAYLVMVDYFSDMILHSMGKDFIENCWINVHEGYWSVVLFPSCVFVWLGHQDTHTGYGSMLLLLYLTGLESLFIHSAILLITTA